MPDSIADRIAKNTADSITVSVAEKLSVLPFISGIVLGGSRARGTHKKDSDIDIGIYYDPESFDLSAINSLASELDSQKRPGRASRRLGRLGERRWMAVYMRTSCGFDPS